jgi:hypothetical protein
VKWTRWSAGSKPTIELSKVLRARLLVFHECIQLNHMLESYDAAAKQSRQHSETLWPIRRSMSLIITLQRVVKAGNEYDTPEEYGTFWYVALDTNSIIFDLLHELSQSSIFSISG